MKLVKKRKCAYLHGNKNKIIYNKYMGIYAQCLERKKSNIYGKVKEFRDWEKI